MPATTTRGTATQAAEALRVASARQDAILAADDAGRPVTKAMTATNAKCWWAWQIIRNGRVSEGFGGYYSATEADLVAALDIIHDYA